MLAPSEMPGSTRKARLLAVADFIEANAVRFDMGDWECCIAGMAALYTTGERHDWGSLYIAKEFFDLDGTEAAKLFMPTPDDLGVDASPFIHCVNAAWAAATLRHFARNGRIDWRKAREQMLHLPVSLSA